MSGPKGHVGSTPALGTNSAPARGCCYFPAEACRVLLSLGIVEGMKKFLRRVLPERVILGYHRALAGLGAWWYGNPSRKLIVVGVTGTKGKTSTANYLWSCLSAGGYTVGLISTANIRIGEHELLNQYHMTMPGRFVIQQLMARMVREGCTFVIVETTSEGIKQYRHHGIAYDVAVFTNLFPEHLTSHGGSFEEYKRMKTKLFALLDAPRKTVAGKRVEKIAIVNGDSEHKAAFLAYPADRKVTFGTGEDVQYRYTDLRKTDDGVAFTVVTPSGAHWPFVLRIMGDFNVANAMPAILLCTASGIPPERIAEGLERLTTIPGRMEKIEEGQTFTVLVDYAHERQSITNVLRTANAMKPAHAKTIILLGAEGGGRDKSKRAVMGELAATMADIVVVSNVDPYDDDPKPILEDIARAAELHGKVREEDLFVVEDRREGIRTALRYAGMDDVVLVTGKGAEQSIIIGGKSSPWDDRTVVREELRRLL